MNRKIALEILLVMLILSICFASAASTTNDLSYFGEVSHIDSIKQLSASVPLVIGASLHSNSIQPLEQPTRLEIYNFIKENPGVHFRGISNALGLSVGVVQYHLIVLERAGFVTGYTDGQNKRYFESNAFTMTDMRLISLLRHETTAKILTILAQNGSTFHKEIALAIGVSSQALTWQMNQLKKTGLINVEKGGINIRYSLSNANVIALILKLTSNLKI